MTLNKSYTSIITACFMLGMVGVFVNQIYNMKTGSIMFYRLLFGFIGIMAFVIALKRYNELRLTKKRPYVLLTGVLTVVCMFSYLSAIKYTSVTIAAMLLYTAPIYVTLLSPILLGERLTTKTVFALMISITGIVMLVNPGASSGTVINNYPLGIIFGLISGLSYAGNIMTFNYLKDDYSDLSLLFWSTLISVVILSPYAIMVTRVVLFENIYILAQFGLITSALASLLYLKGIVKIKAQNASVLSLLEPVSSIFFGYVFLSNPIFMSTIQGCGLVLAGSFVISADSKTISADRYLSFLRRGIYPILDYSRYLTGMGLKKY